ncbi:MAG TPA: tRNA (adenosine(37)-N6)-threonylcarbamoyltransferase complex dimerization subunit type 1 TsaB [Gemmatimonadales bacterium]|nr:tRNA (adenosine(37)-N6)-threonylcarbamoyltransferase complex dimerization subunit type 1 TsaB [Gemmatimonadales bacterium]
MNVLLALDTATSRPSLALGVPGGWADEVVIADRHQLSVAIERVARSLLERHAVTAADLAGLVVADGPGSFTGLRIGIAFAKGVCRALDRPLYAAPSMLGAARAVASAGESVVVEYDALRGDVYRAGWRFEANYIAQLHGPSLVRADEASLPLASARRASESDAGARHLIALVGVEGGAVEIGAVAAWEPAYGRLAEAEARRVARERER